MTDEAIPYEELKDIILSVKQPERLAFFCTLYASAGRIGEICGHTNHPNVTRDYKGLTVYGVEEREMGVIKGNEVVQEPFVIFTLETEKHPQHPRRAIPLNAKEEEWLAEPIIQHVRLSKKQGKVKLFDFTTRWGQKLCREYLDVHPHMLRHCRATHWVKHFGLGAEVQQLLGHSNIKSTSPYLHLNPLDAARKMVFK